MSRQLGKKPSRAGQRDPGGAITAARMPLGKVCKQILDDAEREYAADADLPTLCAETTDLLTSLPANTRSNSSRPSCIVGAAFRERRPALNVFARTLEGVNLSRHPGYLAAMVFLYRHVGPKSVEADYRLRAGRLPAQEPKQQIHYPGREGYPAEPGHGHHSRPEL